MPEGAALMGRDVIGLVALDLVLRIGLRGAMRVPLVIEIAGVNCDDGARDMAGLGIPSDVIPDLEFPGHVVRSSLIEHASRP